VGTLPFLDTRKLNIISDGDDCSVLVVKIYQKHRIGDNKAVGSLSDTVGGVLGRLKVGGM